jgi:ribosomal protein S18 acetylase RimI-like enzyme
MLQGVESLVRDLGIDHLGLSVDSTNAAALALYEAAGYVVATQQMSKTLNGA